MTICSVRGGATPLIDPKPFRWVRLPFASYGRLVMVRSVKLAKFAVAFTPVNCVWFRALNMSTRNSNWLLPYTVTRFDTDMSRLLIGGECRKKREDSAPSLWGCGCAKHAVLICRYGSLLEPPPGSQVRTMRAFGLPSVPVRFWALIPEMLKPTPYGRPLVQRYAPESCHSLISRPRTLLLVKLGNW